jgi:hypothetical protein
MMIEMIRRVESHPPRRRRWSSIAAAAFVCAALETGAPLHADEGAAAISPPPRWICRYLAATPDGPLQVTATFEVIGDELAEVETIPKGLNFSERYRILENTAADIVAAISITKFGDRPPPGIGAVVIIIAKQNGLFQQSGSILGRRTSDPTLGHCERQ